MVLAVLLVLAPVGAKGRAITIRGEKVHTLEGGKVYKDSALCFSQIGEGPGAVFLVSIPPDTRAHTSLSLPPPSPSSSSTLHPHHHHIHCCRD
jgi:hypothetical protein